jgi:SsrA-binding protein
MKKTLKARNKKAKYEYFLSNEIESGIVLKGFEIKSVQNGNIDLTGSYVKIIDNEAYLLNCSISDIKYDKFFQNHKLDNYPIIKDNFELSNRPKKLLLHKQQIKKYSKMLDKKSATLIVTEIYADENNRIKCTLCLGVGKNNIDKRNVIKERDIARKGE